MSAIRKRPSELYHAFLVKPPAGFRPANWQKKPDSYQILEYVGPKKRLGSVDAWRFMHNQKVLADGSYKNGWAIFVK